MLFLSGCGGPISVMMPPQAPLRATKVFVTFELRNPFTTADAEACLCFAQALQEILKTDGYALSDSGDAEISILAQQVSSEYGEWLTLDYRTNPKGDIVSRYKVVVKNTFLITYLDHTGEVLARVRLKGYYGGFDSNCQDDARHVHEFSRRVFLK
jgi:hypothetical protein